MGKRGPKPGLRKLQVAGATISDRGRPSDFHETAEEAAIKVNLFSKNTEPVSMESEPAIVEAGDDVAQIVEPANLEEVPELEEVAAPGTAIARGEIDITQYLSADEFHERMGVIYRLAGQSPPMVMKLLTGTPQPMLQSLIYANEAHGALAREAHNALYQTLIEVDWLRFLVERQTGIWARIAIIGAFGFSLGNAVYAEIQTTWIVVEQQSEPPAEQKPETPPPPPETTPGFVPERPR